jgi:hypothetical protein
MKLSICAFTLTAACGSVSNAFASNRIDCPSQTNWYAAVFSNDLDNNVHGSGTFSWDPKLATARFAPDSMYGFETPTCDVSGSNEYFVWGNARPPGSSCPANASLYIEQSVTDTYGVAWASYNWGTIVTASVTSLDFGYVYCGYYYGAGNTIERHLDCVTQSCTSSFDCAVEDGYVNNPPPIHATSHYFLDYHLIRGCNGGSL